MGLREDNRWRPGRIWNLCDTTLVRGHDHEIFREMTLNSARLDFDFVRNDMYAVLDNWKSIAVSPHWVCDDLGFCAERRVENWTAACVQNLFADCDFSGYV